MGAAHSAYRPSRPPVSLHAAAVQVDETGI